MANTDAPTGFTPRYLRGTDPQFNVYARNGYSIASAYNTDLFQGDPVKSSGTGDTEGRPGIVRAAAGDTVRGVFVGVEYTDSNGERQFNKQWPANTTATDIIAKVADDPDTIFAVQADEDVVAADIGNTADFVAGTGNTNTKFSGFELDSSNIGTGANCKILGLDGLVVGDNNLGENNTKVLVIFNEHELRGTVAGV